MQKKDSSELIQEIVKQIIRISLAIVLAVTAVLLYIAFEESLIEVFKPEPKVTFIPPNPFEEEVDLIVDGIDVASGMKADKDLLIVLAHCTGCHSSKLITQNRATKAGWEQMIDWMQKTQGLPDLGANEPIIVNYLAKYYSPEDVGRRAALSDIEWYILEE